jgi:hypothetical protein
MTFLKKIKTIGLEFLHELKNIFSMYDPFNIRTRMLSMVFIFTVINAFFICRSLLYYFSPEQCVSEPFDDIAFVNILLVCLMLFVSAILIIIGVFLAIIVVFINHRRSKNKSSEEFKYLNLYNRLIYSISNSKIYLFIKRIIKRILINKHGKYRYGSILLQRFGKAITTDRAGYIIASTLIIILIGLLCSEAYKIYYCLY